MSVVVERAAGDLRAVGHLDVAERDAGDLRAKERAACPLGNDDHDDFVHECGVGDFRADECGVGNLRADATGVAS